jgi:hypothetical protein
MRSLLIILLLLAVARAFGQDAEREKIQQLQVQKEMEKTRLIRQQMDSGIYLLEQEQYAAADEKLKYALANMKSIPSDLTFFFGKNSYHIGKYKQSVDWLSKYIQLKGTNGQHSSEATEYLKKAEAALLLEHQNESTKASQVLSRDYTIDCGPNAKIVCPVCNGSTVTIKRDAFGVEKYRTCPYCNKVGYLTCDEYNQLLRGQLKAH